MPQTQNNQINAWLSFVLTLDDVIAAEKQQHPNDSTLTAIRHLVSYATGDHWPDYLAQYADSKQLIKSHLSVTDQDKEFLLTTLSQPLKDFTPEWEFQTEMTSLAGTLKSVASLPVDLTGSVKINAEIDVYNKEDAAKDHQLHIRLSQAMVRFGLEGQLTAGFGTGQLPLANGQFSLSSSAKMKALFDLFFAAPEQSDLIAALPLALKAIPQWGDLDSAWKAMTDPYAPMRMAMVVDGTVEAGAEVQLGKQLTKTFSSASALTADLSLHADLGVKLNVSTLLSGQFELSVTKVDNGALQLKLVKSHSNELQAGLELGASIKIEGSEHLAEKFLANTPDPDDFVKKLQQLASPYEQLQNIVSKQLDQHSNTVLKQLAAVLFNLKEPDEVNKELESYLQQQITLLLTEHFDPWQNKTATQADKVIQSLHLPAAAQAKLTQLLRPSLQDIMTKVKDALNLELKQWAEQLMKLEPPQLMNTLDALGLKIEATLKLPAQTARLIKDAIELLTRYNQKRKELADVITGLSKRQLGLTWMASHHNKNQQQTLCSFRINQNTAVSAALYNCCLSGQLKYLPALLRRAKNEGSVSQVEYLLEQLFSGSKTMGLSIDLFGIELSWKKLVTSTVYFDVDLQGHIVAARLKSEITSRYTLFGEQRVAGLISSEELLSTLQDGEHIGSLSLNYSYKEKKLDIKDAREFFDSLVLTELAAPGLTQRALSKLNMTTTRGQNSRRNIEINLALMVPSSDFIDMSQQSPDTAFDQACAIQFKVAGQLLPAWKEDKLYTKYADLTQNRKKLREFVEKVKPRGIDERGKEQEEVVRRTRIIARGAAKWESYLAELKKLQRYRHSGFATVPKDDLKAVNKSMTKLLSSWVSAKDFGTDDQITWRLAALITLICQSCNLVPSQVVVLELKETGQDAKHFLLK